MRKIIFTALAVAVAMPTAAIVPTEAVTAKDKKKRYEYREWRGRDGKQYCRKPDGTTGLVVGAVAGALAGRVVDTDGDRTAGTLIGGAAGALIGREVERSGKQCR